MIDTTKFPPVQASSEEKKKQPSPKKAPTPLRLPGGAEVYAVYAVAVSDIKARNVYASAMHKPPAHNQHPQGGWFSYKRFDPTK